MNVNAVNTGGAISPNYSVTVEPGGVDDRVGRTTPRPSRLRLNQATQTPKKWLPRCRTGSTR
jgi:hypothetical protein